LLSVDHSSVYGVKLQEARAAKEKKLEDEALLKLQSVVEEMQQLKESLIAAVC